jgi:hypothetical protein
MRTKAESRRYYESIANLALQLSYLLLEDDHNRKLLDTRAGVAPSNRTRCGLKAADELTG